MDVELNYSGDLLELNLAGTLDNESSVYFREVIDSVVHDGWHRVLVRMGDVTYLSSAGIGALLIAHKRLTGLKGFFGICDLQSDVERVLKQTRVLQGLLADPQVVLADIPSGTMTRMSKMRVASQDGVDLQIFSMDPGSDSNIQTGMSCELLGSPESPGDRVVSSDNCRSMVFPPASISIGLGSLGSSFEACKNRFGEYIAVAGAVAQSPSAGGRLPDYSVIRGDYVPELQVVYGLHCEGAFTHLIRFSASDHEHPAPVPLSKLMQVAMQSMDCSAAAIVILGECAGLVGTQLRKSPAMAGASDDASRFAFPQIRDWLSFSAEQVHRRSLVLVAGVVIDRDARLYPELSGFVRPFNADGTVSAHLHAAVFPYQPLKKRTLDLTDSVTELFEAGAIQDVLHLLRDDRAINGAGESEFVSGACWIAPVLGCSSGEQARKHCCTTE